MTLKTYTHPTDYHYSDKVGIRDHQRQKLYTAERLWYDQPAFTSWAFDSTTTISTWISTLLAHSQAHTLWPEPAEYYADHPINVRTHKGGRATLAHACYRRNEIALSKTNNKRAFILPIILHELAHMIHNRQPVALAGRQDHSAHGAEYAATYVELTALVAGHDIAVALNTAFDLSGVKVSDTKRAYELTRCLESVLRCCDLC